MKKAWTVMQERMAKRLDDAIRRDFKVGIIDDPLHEEEPMTKHRVLHGGPGDQHRAAAALDVCPEYGQDRNEAGAKDGINREVPDA